MRSRHHLLTIALLTSLAARVDGQRQDREPGEEMDSGAFANPHLLVTTDWLEKHGLDDGVRLVDAREPGDYGAAHLPGAINIPRSATFAAEGPRSMVGSGEHIARLFGSNGIGGDHHVVIYDEGKSTAAARVFWTLEHYGHLRVSVLDGGYVKWMAEERPVVADIVAVAPASFSPRARPERLTGVDQILEELDLDGGLMLDVRSNREVERGRIPGAVHIEWTRNFTDGEVPVFRSPADLERLYVDQGVTREHRVHSY